MRKRWREREEEMKQKNKIKKRRKRRTRREEDEDRGGGEEPEVNSVIDQVDSTLQPLDDVNQHIDKLPPGVHIQHPELFGVKVFPESFQ